MLPGQDRMRQGQIALEPPRGTLPRGSQVKRERESVCVLRSRIVEFTNLRVILDHG